MAKTFKKLGLHKQPHIENGLYDLVGGNPIKWHQKLNHIWKKNTQETFSASPQLSNYINRIIPLYVPITPVVGKLTISPSNPT